MLLFILSPILVASVLRTFARDGWRDAGLRLRLRGNGRWYALSLLLFPVLSAVAVGLGAAFGAVEFAPGAAQEFAALFATALVTAFIYSVFEEFGWRGYLEPRMQALGVPAARRHLIVAAVWGLWHVPYILAVDVMTDLPLAGYIPLFLLAIVPMAFIYGVVRERTGTVWPAVIMHALANAVAFPLLSDAVVTDGGGLVFAARPEGLITLAGLIITAVLVWRSRPSIPAS
jgi:membrane protease YdiL (CAAX protease family)